MTKIIGLTGGIGSGKLLANHFQSLTVYIYGRWSTRKIMQTPDVIDAIKETFGTTF
jgi:dephospho-CoA kinase